MYGNCFWVVCVTRCSNTNNLGIRKMIDWVPVVFVIFKALVLGIGMFYAIKWHYDRGRKGKVTERRAVLRATGKVAAIFVLALLGLGLFTLFLVRTLHLNLSSS